VDIVDGRCSRRFGDGRWTTASTVDVGIVVVGSESGIDRVYGEHAAFWRADDATGDGFQPILDLVLPSYSLRSTQNNNLLKQLSVDA